MSHWRLGDLALGLLTAMAVLAAWEGFALNNRPETSGYGGDFAQFYTAGQIIAHGESARLYDQAYFKHLQEPTREDPQSSLYPPTMALAMSPLGRLSYFGALHVWWAIQAVCLVATAVIFYRTTPLTRLWRVNMLLALAALLPLWIAVGIGHLAPMLLLALTAGLTLHRSGRLLLAGCILSLLAAKPQLAIGLGVWMLLRRDLRTLAGLALGGLLQAAVVAVVLGPSMWLDYLHAMPAAAASIRAYRYSPLFEQSFAGIASNLAVAAGARWLELPAMKIVYALTAAVAAVALCRVVAARRPFRLPSLTLRVSRNDSPHSLARASDWYVGNYEYACGVLFMTIFPPYYLVYDQALLAVPLVLLWATPAWRWGVALLAVMAVPLANLSFSLGFSVTAAVALAAMVALAREASKAAPTDIRSDRSRWFPGYGSLAVCGTSRLPRGLE